MNILITGGAGYVGSTLVKMLTEEGHNVVSIDNLSRGDYMHLRRAVGKSNVRMLVGDISCLKSLEEAMEGENLDAVVHAAAIPGLERCQKNPERAVLTNIYGTYNVLEAARRFDVERVIFTSSAAVYGNPVKTPIREDHPLNPINLYGVTKLSSEMLLNVYHETYGLSTVILRFGNVYGVGVYTYWETVIPKFVRQALNGEPLTIYGDGGQSRDFIHVYDIVRAVKLALNAEDSVVRGEAFNVGTGKPTSVNAIANVISKTLLEETGKAPEIIHLPPRSGEPYTPNFCLSPKKIREKLRFEASWGIEEGVRQLIKYSRRVVG